MVVWEGVGALTWEGAMTWGFSSCTGKGTCSSCAKESNGDRVPLVSKMDRTPNAAMAFMATPGSKHQ